MAFLTDKDILIIDDAPDIRLLAQRILEGDGAHVFHADHVDAGIDFISKKSPHLILVDLNMPSKSGFDFLNYRLSSEAVKLIPSLVLSGLNDRISVSKAISLGANDYILKPFSAALLLQKVRKALKLASFQNYHFPEGERPSATILVKAEVVRISETGLKLESPIRISPEENVEIHARFLDEDLGCKDVKMRAAKVPARYQMEGRYLTEINFIGVGDAFSRQVRQTLRNWK